nr:MAG TPA: Protein of unknown function (DUF3767) [Caudoviricetes sp.]
MPGTQNGLTILLTSTKSERIEHFGLEKLNSLTEIPCFR